MSKNTSNQINPQPSSLCPTGGFDVPREKCPPDIQAGGSLDEVTVRSTHSSSVTTSSRPSSIISTSSDSTSSSASSLIFSEPTLSSPPSQRRSDLKPNHSIVSPRPIPHRNHSSHAIERFDLPLTPPRSSSDSIASGGISDDPRQHHSTFGSAGAPTYEAVVNGFSISVREPITLETPPTTPRSLEAWPAKNSGALEFLFDLFPKSALGAVPHAKSVSISQGDVTWEGVVLELPGQPKTLYVGGKGAESVRLRESIVALLDLADEHLGCSSFVIVLERKSPALAGLLHSLMYVSGTVVTKPPFEVNPKYVLVGMEI